MPPFLLSALFLFVIWLLLILVSKETRKEQIIMSIIGLLAAPSLVFIASTDYQQLINNQPIPFSVEDVLFSFSLFGIASIIYHVLLGKHMHKFRGKRLKIKNPAFHFLFHFAFVLGVWACLALGSVLLFQLDVIHAFILGGLIVGIYIIAERHDLLLDAVMSGIMMALLIFFVEHIFFFRLFPDTSTHFWQWSTVSTFFLTNVPVVEIIWATVVGFTIGPMYEWLRQRALK